MKRFLAVILILTFYCGVAWAGQEITAVATGSGALSHSVTFTKPAWVKTIKVHLNSAATTETLTISVDSQLGTAYDTQILSQAMAGTQDLLWLPEGQLRIAAGDTVTMSWTNTDGRTWGAEINYEY